MATTSAIDPAPIEALYNGLSSWVDTDVQDPKLFGARRELPFFSDGILYSRLGMPIAYMLPTSDKEVKTLFVTALKLRVQADNPNTAYGDGAVRNVLLSVAKSRALPVFCCINPEQYSWIKEIGSVSSYQEVELYANNFSAEWMGLVAQAIYFFRDSQSGEANFGQKKYDAERSLDCARTIRWLKAKLDASPEDAVVKMVKEMIGYDKNEAEVLRLLGDLQSNFNSFLEELEKVRSRRANEEGTAAEDREIL